MCRVKRQSWFSLRCTNTKVASRMLRTSTNALRARITAFSPWMQRPSGLRRNSNPQTVHPGHFRNSYRRRNPDDPSRLLKPSHVLLKICHQCRRTKYVFLHEKDFFHTCCEGLPMVLQSSMKSVMNNSRKLTSAVRQWDVENDRPWSNAHRPKPKGRSKLRK